MAHKIADLTPELEPRHFNPISPPTQAGFAAAELEAQSNMESKG